MFQTKSTTLFSLLLITCLFNDSTVKAAQSLTLIQVLNDNINGIDGLANPRDIKIKADNTRVFISSGDDNALAIFNADKYFNLTFSQLFKNSPPTLKGLEGASGLTYLPMHQQVAVTGFYDGALALFNETDTTITYRNTLSDDLRYKNVFADNAVLKSPDTLGLLGAWEVIHSANEKQLLVASYMSNAISIFDVKADHTVAFKQKITHAKPYADRLGKPVSLALSPSNDALFVLGYENHQLTIFDRQTDGALSVKQVIEHSEDGVTHCLNPQKIVTSPHGQFLYVACSGSHSIGVLQKAPNGKYRFIKAITNAEIGNDSLKGASSLAISNKGDMLYAAGELGTGLHVFNVQEDAKLALKESLYHVGEHKLKGISSLTLTPDNRHLLVATGKGNSLIILKRQL